MPPQELAIAAESFALNRAVKMEWKLPNVSAVHEEKPTLVFLQATGMPVGDVQRFGRALRARRDLLKKGWAGPEGFAEAIAVPIRKVREGVVSSLSFLSIDRVTRVSIQASYRDAPSLPFSDVGQAQDTVQLV
jgi:hypothetical protein